MRLAQANLITKTDFDAKLSRINRKIRENETENVLVKNELNKLKTFDSSYFIGWYSELFSISTTIQLF